MPAMHEASISIMDTLRRTTFREGPMFAPNAPPPDGSQDAK
jgi:hypothetical protein